MFSSSEWHRADSVWETQDKPNYKSHQPPHNKEGLCRDEQIQNDDYSSDAGYYS